MNSNVKNIINMSKPRLIAFYLPQYYPTKENDEWWQEGFTEWTNVGNARPLFKGHYQPKVPADLGYYDLRVPEVREHQVRLAREAGIEGFCYWHYWFEGRRLLDRVFKEVVENGTPDFPFCLCWANHSWYRKTWDPNKPNKLLIEQTYSGKEDYIAHFNAMLPAFKDSRYMKVNGKLIFGVFAAMDIPNQKEFFDTWNCLAKENGLEGFYFFGFTFDHQEVPIILERGFDSACIDNVMAVSSTQNILSRFMWRLIKKITKIPKLISYDEYTKLFQKLYEVNDRIHPCIVPNFDHSPRSRHRGTIIVESSPNKWKQFCKSIFSKVKNRKQEENIVFIKAWNEWGEGNYLEPDLKYGKQFIEATREALDNFER